MTLGLLGGFLWALDTVLLGLAFPALSLCLPLWLAPLVSTFLHDAVSALLLHGGLLLRGRWWRDMKALFRAFPWLLLLGALLGGPVGMVGYVASVQQLGAGYAAVISALYPALGALLAQLLLKQRMKPRQWLGLLLSVVGMVGMSLWGTASGALTLPGILLGLLCCLGWACEGVVCSKVQQTTALQESMLLTLRQTVSALTFALLLLPMMGLRSSFPLAVGEGWLLPVAALAGTLSYLCYYGAIRRLGTGRAMALNATYPVWALVLVFVAEGTLPAGGALLFAALTLAGGLLCGLP